MTSSAHHDETEPLLRGGPSSVPPDDTGNTGPASHLQLYLSHFLSTWNSRVFEFASVLFLASIYPSTFVPLSCYALIRSVAAIFLGSSVGQYIDNNERLKVVRVSIVARRIAILASCVGFWVLIFKKTTRTVELAVFAALVALACVEKLCSILNLVAVERDWLVIIAGTDENALRVLNSQMRRIDLFCKLLGPLAISLIHSTSMRTAVLVVFGTNLISASIEYANIERVYRSVPALQLPRPTRAIEESLPSVSNTTASISSPGILHQFTAWLRQTKHNFSLYYNHPVFLPSFSESLLYFTVLSFSSQMIAYLISIGYSPGKVGILRTFSVGWEVSATWLAPLAMRKVGPIRAGLWFVNWQTLCLIFSVANLVGVLDFGRGLGWGMDVDVDWRGFGFVAGVIASRVGLWGFDLCVQTLIQENVEPEHRGTFSAVESSVQSIFEVCAFLSTIIFSRPEEFVYPSLMSAAAVAVAGVLYAMFVRTKRGHLLHVNFYCT
ncbi:hypothetical protein BDN72DRAFT_842291 [Pluteus cervinus]|uniref:Uncharacterized protein n=1 Tax=Pluteus cervinus TaxID=181527 RepID=A0ACD3ARC9_9AGAR|nr:hypothetical protein BDN72DRAFT_842291 [Pluteus cervinus]